MNLEIIITGVSLLETGSTAMRWPFHILHIRMWVCES
jgi:hypothetical protein